MEHETQKQSVLVGHVFRDGQFDLIVFELNFQHVFEVDPVVVWLRRYV